MNTEIPSLTSSLILTVLTLISFLVALTFHEFCHALVATLLGDDTARRNGRLTLNPLAHIDPLGLFFLILVRFGWAKPVPFNPQNFSHPRLYSILVGLAGPTANFLIAFLCIVLFHYIPTGIVGSFLQISIWINAMLGVFNLLPLPPLDGSHLISANLPPSMLSSYIRLQPFFLLMLIIFLMIPAFNQMLLKAIFLAIATLEALARYFLF